MVLTNFPHNSLLDLDPWVGQRSATYRFEVTNGVTGLSMGTVNPIRIGNLSHDTTKAIKRELKLAFGVADMAAINTLQDRISVFMVFGNGEEYPLGRYMFTDASRRVFTSGSLGNMILSDEMFLVDQPITAGINGVGFGVSQVIQTVLAGLPIEWKLEPAPYVCAESWGVGTNRGAILESLSISGNLFSPWFDNNGTLRFIETFNPADKIPDFNYDIGNQVMRSAILETDDLLTAPNVFVVISNNAADSSQEVVARAQIPPNAPHSVVNRGFEIAEVVDLQLSNVAQAQAVAIGLVNRQTIFERVSLTTAPDPRFDSYNVVYWQGDLWLDLAWELDLVEGAPMHHLLRRSYIGNEVAAIVNPDLA